MVYSFGHFGGSSNEPQYIGVYCFGCLGIQAVVGLTWIVLKQRALLHVPVVLPRGSRCTSERNRVPKSL